MSKEINVYHLRTTTSTKEVVKDGVAKTIKVGGTPYATVAISFNEDGTINRGISICSPNDMFLKSVGTAKAIGRLKKAVKAQSNIMPIFGFNHLIHRIMRKKGTNPKDTVMFDNLGYYKAEPNDLEKSIFKDELGLAKR